MRAAERGVLLLCCALGDPGARPLSMAQFRELSLRAQAIGPGGGDFSAELRAEHLLRLGYGPDEAERIATLLSRGERLDRYLAAAERRGVVPVTRVSAGYPAPVAAKRGASCPPALFCAGNTALFSTKCVGLAGSRRLRPENAAFARRAGELAAAEGLTLVTGGAEGADSEAADACLRAGGSVIVFVPDRLDGRAERAGGRCLLASEDGYDLPFTAARALSRNRLIYQMGGSTLIAQVGSGHGGTWAGAADDLRGGWSALFVFDDGSDGAQALIGRGASPVRELTSISRLRPDQLRMEPDGNF